ncbi:unnamed protein product [Linum tenue]|uniref:J domain-containing protein n=1 Tax=Linum tenue TaxID=586396 RepID=A0AAV0GR53_9ROSI|nr:unnamed protein product [Linum tenue]
MPAAALDIGSRMTTPRDAADNLFGPGLSFDFGPLPSADPNSLFASGGGGGASQLESDLASKNSSGVGAAASGRTRPRLVKVRRQINGRAKVASNGTGFNPFSSSDAISAKDVSSGIDCSSSSTSAGFVFVAPQSSWNDALKFNYGEKEEDSGCEMKPTRCENASSVSEAAEKKQANDGDKFDGGFDFLNLGSQGSGFVFGTAKAQSGNMGFPAANFVFSKDSLDPASSSNGQNNQSAETPQTSASDDSAGIRAANVAGYTISIGDGVFPSDTSSEKASTSYGCTVRNVRDEGKMSGVSFQPLSGKASYKDVENSDSAVRTNPVADLPDKLEKLNIDESKGLDGADKNPCTNDVPSNAFKSGKVAMSSSASCVNANIHEGNPAEAAGVEDTDSEKLGLNKEQNHGMSGASTGFPSSDSFTVPSGIASTPFEGGLEQDQVNGVAELSQAGTKSSVQWVGIGSGDSEAAGVMPERGENYSCSTSASEGLEVPVTEFRTPEWDPSCLKASLFPELNKKLSPTSKTRLRRDKKSKPTRGRMKHPSQNILFSEEGHVKNGDSPQMNMKSPQTYSPMDFSPYDGNATGRQFSLRDSLESNNRDKHSTVNAAGHGVGVNKCQDHGKSRAENAGIYGFHSEMCSPSTDFSLGMGMSLTDSTSEPAHSNSSSCLVPGSLNMDNSSQQAQFCFASESEETKIARFSFSAGCSASGLLEKKHRYRKKNGRKTSGSIVNSTSPNAKSRSSSVQNFTHDTTTSSFDSIQDRTGHLSFQGIVGNESKFRDHVSRPFVPPTVAIVGACEAWRLRGNQAYRDGELSKAEDFYSQGINSVPSSELSACLEPLVICYSNRAAARMSLGNIREALQDCLMAASLDPSFLKVQIRAANCYLLLGEVEDALLCFNKCLETSNGFCLDRRITIEAAEGVHKAKKVADCIDRSNELLEQKTPDTSSTALESINEALSISPYSERLLELKAEFMFKLRKYEEVIKFCEQTLPAGETNIDGFGNDSQSVNTISSQSQSCSVSRLWRWRSISKSYFNLGKLDDAVDLLGKIEKMGPFSDKYASRLFESSISVLATIRDLLQHKTAGNEAFRSGNYKEAVEQYSAALSSNIESRPFAAICFCNRAAAYQAMGQLADAIADCSLSVALDGNYSKAVSRRATLHEMIRDYGQAASDLQRFITIRENRPDVGQSSTPRRSTSGSKELKQYRRKLSSMEEEAKKGTTLDLYRILGVKESDSAADIKKAYRKAALRHHPDKAGQLLARSESGDGLWKEIVDKVHVDADRLFKMIGEAYAVLSDSDKRSKYDHEEDIRKLSKENQGNSSNRRTADHSSSPYSSPFSSAYTPFGKSEYRRSNRQQDSWRTYGYSYSRW